jgi:hypothetical protein
VKHLTCPSFFDDDEIMKHGLWALNWEEAKKRMAKKRKEISKT